MECHLKQEQNGKQPCSQVVLAGQRRMNTLQASKSGHLKALMSANRITYRYEHKRDKPNFCCWRVTLCVSDMHCPIMDATASYTRNFAIFQIYLLCWTFPPLSPYDSSASPVAPVSSSSTVTSPMTGPPTLSKPRSMTLAASSTEDEAEPRVAVRGTLPTAEPWVCKVPNPVSAFSNSKSTREMLTFPKWSPLSICKTGTLVKYAIYMPLTL